MWVQKKQPKDKKQNPTSVKEKVLDKQQSNVLTVKISERINYELKDPPVIKRKEEKAEPVINTKIETKHLSKKEEKSAKAKNKETKPLPQRICGLEQEDAERKMKQMEQELVQKRKQLNEYMEEQVAMRRILYPMLEREYYLNQDIAESIVNKYGVNPVNKDYRYNIDNPQAILEAVHWIKYCHEVTDNDVVEEMKRLQNEKLMMKAEKDALDEKMKIMQKERETEREEMQKVVKTFQVKYTNMQKELAEKSEEVLRLSDLLQEQQLRSEDSFEMNEAFEPEMNFDEELKEDLDTEANEVAYDELDTELNEESYEVVNVEPYETLNEELNISVEKEHLDAVFEADEKQEPDEDFLDILDGILDQEQEEEVAEEMPYVQLLKQKGYQVEMAETDQYDYLVEKEEGEKIPLRYIYYDIEKSEEFDDMMRYTDKMYFVFDDKKRLYKGNTKFTAWLLKQKERKYNIHFSFTTVEQLKTSGLTALDGM